MHMGSRSQTHKHVRATAVASMHVQHRVKYYLLVGDQCPDEFGSIKFNSYSKLVARQVILHQQHL